MEITTVVLMYAFASVVKELSLANMLRLCFDLVSAHDTFPVLLPFNQPSPNPPMIAFLISGLVVYSKSRLQKEDKKMSQSSDGTVNQIVLSPIHGFPKILITVKTKCSNVFFWKCYKHSYNNSLLPPTRVRNLNQLARLV